MIDRDYRFLIRTFDAAAAPAIALDALADRMGAAGFPGWRCGAGITSVNGYRKVGDVDLQTDELGARDWAYCIVAELDADADFPAITAEVIASERMALAALGLELLSIEGAIRPAGAGTAIPRASRHWGAFPAHFEAAIEYIDIPPHHWEDYRTFMREMFGPVGRRLVEHGDSYTVVITEVERAYFRDPSLPDWNRVHILTGDFLSPSGGFFDRTAAHVRSIVGAGHSVESALGIASYRRKPRMSRNRLELSDQCSEAPKA